MIVVDASVAAKWFLPEFATRWARALMSGSELLTAPDIARSEVAAAIVRRVRTEGMQAEDAAAPLSTWKRTIDRRLITILPTEPLIDDAAHLAIEMRHTLQDCLYLALARRNDALMVTADRRFAERSAAHHDRIELLAAD